MASLVSLYRQDVIIIYGGIVENGQQVQELSYNVSSFTCSYPTGTNKRIADVITQLNSEVKVKIKTQLSETDQSNGDLEGTHRVDKLTNFEGDKISDLNDIVDRVRLKLKKFGL